MNGIDAGLQKFQAARADSVLAKAGATDKEKLRETADEFESLLVKQLLDEMRKSLHKENLLADKGQGEEIFEDMLYTEYARKFAKSGDFGIAEAICRQFEPSVPARPYQ